MAVTTAVKVGEAIRINIGVGWTEEKSGRVWEGESDDEEKESRMWQAHSKWREARSDRNWQEARELQDDEQARRGHLGSNAEQKQKTDTHTHRGHSGLDGAWSVSMKVQTDEVTLASGSRNENDEESCGFQCCCGLPNCPLCGSSAARRSWEHQSTHGTSTEDIVRRTAQEKVQEKSFDKR